MDSLKMRALALAMVIVGACGDDGKGGTGEHSADGGPTTTTTGKSMDGGTVATIDSGNASRPQTDGALSDAAVSDAGAPVEVITDGALPVSLVPLPNDGTRLSTCYDDGDCNKSLTCVAPLGVLGAGFCNDDCHADTDCQAVDGVAGSCALEGQCVFDCSHMGAGDGPCPTNMACRNVVPPGVLALPTYRCTYPLGSGSKSVASYGECDLGHGGGDCVGAQSCHVPVGDVVTVVTSPIGPGYCAPGCTAPTDCQVPSGVTSAAVCNFGECELDCSAKGVTCPKGMNCIDVDDAPLLTTLRCRIIN